MENEKPAKSTIIHVITGLRSGGAEAMLYKLLKSNASSYEQVVVSLTKGGKYVDLLADLNVEVFELDLSNHPFNFRMIYQIVSKYKTVIVHAWMYHAMLFCAIFLFKKRKTVKIIWNVRHSLSDTMNETLRLRVVIFFLAKLVKIPDKIIFNSKASLEQHNRIWKAEIKSLHIPNGFDLNAMPNYPEKRAEIRSALGLSDGDYLIGNVARVHPMKNHHGLINAFLECAQINSNIYLLLIGNGTDKLCLPSISESKRIILIGEVTNILEYMTAMDCFILPSKWGEGFPNVIGEAMATGLICIVSDVGDNALLIDDERFIIKVDELYKLADVIELTLNLEEKAASRVKHWNQTSISSNYKIEVINDKYHQLHDTL